MSELEQRSQLTKGIVTERDEALAEIERLRVIIADVEELCNWWHDEVAEIHKLVSSEIDTWGNW